MNTTNNVTATAASVFLSTVTLQGKIDRVNALIAKAKGDQTIAKANAALAELRSLYEQAKTRESKVEEGTARLVKARALYLKAKGSTAKVSLKVEDAMRKAAARFRDYFLENGVASVIVEEGRTVHVEQDDVLGIIADDFSTIEMIPDECRPVAKEDHEGWVAKSTTILGDAKLYEVLRPAAVPDEGVPSFKGGYDAYRGLQDIDEFASNEGERLNSIAKLTASSKGSLIGDFANPETNAGHPRKAPAAIYRLGVGQCKHFQGDGPEELSAYTARYGAITKRFEYDAAAKTLTKKIARNLFDRVIESDKLLEAMDDIRADSVYKGWTAKARSAGYASSHSLIAEECETELRFHPKQNAKVSETPITSENVTKAPQGISAWDKAANSYFGPFCRFVADVIRYSLKDNIVWNNGMSVAEAAKRYTAACSKIPTNDNATFDAVQMDSLQNEFTHMINKEFDCLLGFDEEIIERYYERLREYRLLGKEFSVYLEWIMPSGMPWTLKNNSFLEMAVVLYIMEYKNEPAVFSQGDDLNLQAVDMVLNTNKLREIQQFCNFDMTVQFSQTASFCGFTQAHGVLAPNIRRKAYKLLAASVASEVHFHCWRTSVLDWAKALISDPAYVDIVQLNAETYNCGFDQMEGLVEAIESLGHCSWESYKDIAFNVQKNIHYLQFNSVTKDFSNLGQVY